jgi:hypothetical protein
MGHPNTGSQAKEKRRLPSAAYPELWTLLLDFSPELVKNSG